GVDGLYGTDDVKSNTSSRGFDTSKVDLKTAVVYNGFGAVAWLRYNLTDNISIGTEASFYQKMRTQKQNLSVETRNNAIMGRPITYTTSKEEHKLNEGVINLPIAFFLVVRF